MYFIKLNLEVVKSQVYFFIYRLFEKKEVEISSFSHKSPYLWLFPVHYRKKFPSPSLMKNEPGFKPSTSKDSWLLLNMFLCMIRFSKHRPSTDPTPGFLLSTRQLKIHRGESLCTERWGKKNKQASVALGCSWCSEPGWEDWGLA